MKNWFEHNDIDYADVMMLCGAALAGVPAAVLVGYGIYSMAINSVSLIASIL